MEYSYTNHTTSPLQCLDLYAPISKHAGLPLQPGHAERREFEYRRHGTLAAIVSRDVVSGAVLEPMLGPMRKEEDFADHIAGLVSRDPS